MNFANFDVLNFHMEDVVVELVSRGVGKLGEGDVLADVSSRVPGKDSFSKILLTLPSSSPLLPNLILLLDGVDTDDSVTFLLAGLEMVRMFSLAVVDWSLALPTLATFSLFSSLSTVLTIISITHSMVTSWKILLPSS